MGTALLAPHGSAQAIRIPEAQCMPHGSTAALAAKNERPCERACAASARASGPCSPIRWRTTCWGA